MSKLFVFVTSLTFVKRLLSSKVIVEITSTGNSAKKMNELEMALLRKLFQFLFFGIL